MDQNYEEILEENRQRIERIHADYNPVSGLNANGERKKVFIKEAPIEEMYLPLNMINESLFVRRVIRYGLKGYIEKFVKGIEFSEESYEAIWIEFIKTRIRYDFEYWAFSFIVIRSKTEHKNIPFKLNRAQRKLLKTLERLRVQGKPIKFILLKARQWGGSTMIQIYMLWIMLVHKTNWNSVICGDVESQSRNVRAMLSRAINNYPSYLLGEHIKFTPFEGSSKNKIIKNTECVVSIGSFQKPDTLRSGDISGAHLTEVGLWQATAGKKPEDLVQSIEGSVYDMAYTFYGIESTAKGVGNFFHREWERAVRGLSNLEAVFVAWFEIDIYSIKVDDYISFMESMDEYEWCLWKLGATLEAIAWYRKKKRDLKDTWRMNSEYPSTPEEAFQSTGRRRFRLSDTLRLRDTCMNPDFIGDITGRSATGPDSIADLQLERSELGDLSIWKMPDKSKQYRNRYIVVMDVGGVSNKADYTDIAVFDRYWMMEGGVPEVVAEWHGHIDLDKGAWKAVQLACFYADDHNALVVIESNTLETHRTEGDHFEYILYEIANHYSNLYSRTPPDQIKPGTPPVYGFHTNRATKVTVIDHQEKVIRDSLYIERCMEAVDEHDTFEFKEDGKTMGAVDGMHDDRIMVRAIGVYICYETPLPYEIRTYSDLPQIRVVSEATI